MLTSSAAVLVLAHQLKALIFYPQIGSGISNHPYMGVKAKKNLFIPYVGYLS